MTHIRKAVFPVAGMGTRFLPATKSIPKEMLPLIDRPLIQYAVDEARAAGIEEFIFVTAAGKGALEDYFDHAPELENKLRDSDSPAGTAAPGQPADQLISTASAAAMTAVVASEIAKHDKVDDEDGSGS